MIIESYYMGNQNKFLLLEHPFLKTRFTHLTSDSNLKSKRAFLSITNFNNLYIKNTTS